MKTDHVKGKVALIRTEVPREWHSLDLSPRLPTLRRSSLFAAHGTAMCPFRFAY
jgi:hypothetical protein